MGYGGEVDRRTLCGVNPVTQVNNPRDMRHNRIQRKLFFVVTVWALGTVTGCIGLSEPSPQMYPADSSVDASPGDATVLDARVESAPQDSTPFDAAIGCEGTCDPIAQDCAAGQCVVEAGIATCSMAAGLALESEPCASESDCGVGLTCAPSGRGLVCARLCCGTAQCEVGEQCISSRGSWGHCLTPSNCDLAPASAGACPMGTSCYLIDGSGASSCLSPGMLPEGELCYGPNDCVSGTLCVGIPNRRCATLCSLGSAPSCQMGQRCVEQSYLPRNLGLCRS